MSLTRQDVERLQQLLDATAFDELSLQFDGVRITLERSAAASVRPAPRRDGEPLTAAAGGSAAELTEIRAPMSGVFYCAPAPGAQPFVQPGARVRDDTVVGIIEVMKLMNAVHAGMRGVVDEIVALNGNLVERGAVLMRVRSE